MAGMGDGEATTDFIIGEFERWKKEGPDDGDEAVAAVKALFGAVRASTAGTVTELEAEIKAAVQELKSLEKPYGSLSAACDMFLRYVVTRGGDDQITPVSAVKRRLVSRARRFEDIYGGARATVATLCQDFLLDGCTVLVHGHSAAVLDALKLAAASGKRLRVLCAEGRPDGAGLRLAGELAAAGIPARVLLDLAVAYAMSEVDMVLVGADVVTETGGVVGAVGTYQVALVARALNRPVYVAAESYKFARLYPLGHKDIEHGSGRAMDFGGQPVPRGVDVDTAVRDYTPPQHLELLITDLGVLPPPAVGDVLLQLSM